MVQQQEETAVSAVWKRIQNVLFMDLHPRPFMIETAATRRYRAQARLSSRGIAPGAAPGEQTVAPTAKRSALSTTFSGPLERGRETPYAIAGNDFIVTPDTWIFGNLDVGASSTITTQHVDGKLVAKKVVMR